MSWISASDPLALVAIQAGQVNAPSAARAVASTTQLDAQQRYVKLGDPVPIVFARFRNSKGGILVSPGATEARFSNNLNNDVTASYHLPISEGQISSIAVKDVFQRACRVGSHTQTYNRRAGTWAPGNFLVQRAGKTLPTAPYFCGSVGIYPSISTLSFTVTIPDGFDQYNRQVHLFIRGGMYVTRIYDSVFGPSDNFADLIKWLVVNTSRVPTAMVDNAAMLSAATFLEYNSFTCNCELKQGVNLSDLISSWAPYFLLCESNNEGKKGLRPLLPVTATGAINTGTIMPEYVFTEDMILPETIEINYLSLADRLPFVAQMVWRQQLESNIGIIRTAEVRYAGTATAGPYETHDLSAFCTNENHAVKVGAYILAKRTYPTHIIRFTARPQAHNVDVTVGDIISVNLQRQATNYVASSHHYLYQVERITKTLAGDVTYEASHFPVDDQNRSLIALDVAAATGTGLIIPNTRTGVSCDVNSSTDNTIPAEQYIEPGDGNDPTDSSGTSISTSYGATITLIPGGNNNGGPREEEPEDGTPNDDDPLDNDTPPVSGKDPNGNGLVGLPLTVGTPCNVQWLRDGSPISGATSNTYTPTGDDLGKTITPQVTCPGGAPQLLDLIPVLMVMPQSPTGAAQTVTVTVQYDSINLGYNCTTGLPTFVNDPPAGSKTYTNITCKKVSVYTLGVSGEYLSPTITYAVPCNDQASRRRNGAAVFTSAANVDTVDSFVGWAGNITSNDRKTLFHTSYISSIQSGGQEVLDLWLLAAVDNGATYWTDGGIVV